VSIICTLKQEDVMHKELQVEVLDTGVGINFEDQSKLFELFGSLENTREIN
jgi:signal transduction histidine kinase